jgi:N6-L-threonylcarbamoyladenine synthase
MEGHGRFTQVGRTRDDAAGEAFDKGARVLGLSYPGGPSIQKAALASAVKEPPFTRPNVRDSFDFSFSGLKTALLRRAEERGLYPNPPADGEDNAIVASVAAAFQNAIVDALVHRTVEAAQHYGVNGILVVGGVAANSLLRQEFQEKSPMPVVVPRPGLCTDNGAMIGAAGFYAFQESPGVQQWDMDIVPGLKLG